MDEVVAQAESVAASAMAENIPVGDNLVMRSPVQMLQKAIHPNRACTACRQLLPQSQIETRTQSRNI
jgi:hypothetical protein